jgi:hypothetical protein
LSPSANSTCGDQPSSVRSRSLDAVTCRTSPNRNWPVTTGAGPPSASDKPSARSPTVRGVPLPTLKARLTPAPAAAAAVHSSAATLAAAASRTCTKSRRCPPSSKTRGAFPAANADRKIAATPAYGVSSGILGP